VLLPLLILSGLYLVMGKQIFLPSFDEGRITVSVVGDSGTRLDEMDATVRRLEQLFLDDPVVSSVFTTAGGFIFGRSEFETSSRSGLYLQLVPLSQRQISSDQWVRQMQKKIRALDLVGYKVRMRVQGIRGFRLGRGDDDISLRIQGPDIDTLSRLGSAVVERLRGIEGLRNLQHNYENLREELVVNIDRARAAVLGIRPEALGHALQVALDGRVVSSYIEGDRQYDIRLRIPRRALPSTEELENLYIGLQQDSPIRLRDVARLQLALTPNRIKRDNQRRIVEISATLAKGLSPDEVMDRIEARLADFPLPEGYTLYEGGLRQSLQEGRQLGYLLLALALFLVYVVMAVQYESLRNPLVIMLGIPFAGIGVVATLLLFGVELSMTVWLGLIMLAGIVVNNAIVLVEQIEIERETGDSLLPAVIRAARIRLRPILMTTLTTATGMLPLALGLGEGSEMLQPLAIVIVSGLLFSMLVSLLVIPALYLLLHGNLAANPAK
jgi:multidrug efflux pump subunit AcrB